MAVQNNAISVGNNILVDTNLDLYANSITYRSLSYRGYVGTVAGFSFGGANSTGPAQTFGPVAAPTSTLRTEIERFTFASDSTITSIGTLNTPRGNITGHSSATHVYNAGGITNYAGPPYSPNGTVIDRFPYATPFVNSASVGSLTGSRATGAGLSGENNGFVATGRIPDSSTITAGIDRFSFTSTPTTAVAIGSDLAGSRQYATGVSGGKDGYIIGGSTAVDTTGLTNAIWKFPYTAGSRSTLVGSLSVAKLASGGISSITNGYVIGGQINSNPNPNTPNAAVSYTNIIDKFPFASEIYNAINTGTLTQSKSYMSTQSSTTFGYSCGGTNTPPFVQPPVSPQPTSSFLFALSPAPTAYGLGYAGQVTTLEKFPFAAGSVTGASVATLSVGKWGCAGAQY